MQIAPVPANESERLTALRRYAILDTPSEPQFDDFTWLASHLCGTPIAMISLVDADRQWFKSKVGLDTPGTPRDHAFCAHAILENKIFEVPNALEDERFHDNPLVTGAPNVRFYAGMPLTTPEGLNIGTLCVVDQRPRELSAEQRGALERLGRQVVVQLELRLAVLRRQRNEQRLALQNEVSHILIKSQSLANAVPDLLAAIGVCLGYKLGAVWKPDASGGFLRCEEIFCEPGVNAAEFAAGHRKKTFVSGEGLPGRVWATGEPAWVADIAQDSNFPGAPAAVAAGLHAAFGFPLLLGDTGLGVMEFIREGVVPPDAELLHVLATIGRQIGEFMERKRIQSEFEREQFLMQVLLDHVPEQIYFKDAQSRFLRSNAAQARRFGLADPSHVVGKTDFDFFSAEYALEAFAADQEVMRTGLPIVKEEREVRPDGRVNWVRTCKLALRDAQGNIIGTFGIAHDLAEPRPPTGEALESNAATAANVDCAASNPQHADNRCT